MAERRARRGSGRLVSIAAALLAVCLLSTATAFAGVVVNPDRTVTLTFEAPAAETVVVTGIRGREDTALVKDEKGDWSVTVGPLPPDIYEYSLLIDGAKVLDPRNRRVKQWLVSQNQFEIPGTPPRLQEERDVPHGAVHYHIYPSSTVGQGRPVAVYTPPGYRPREARDYPVLYLLHGFGENHDSWIHNGRVHLIADNLIAEGKMEPMLIVLPYGHPGPIPPQGPGFNMIRYRAENQPVYLQDITTDLMPYIAAHYKVKAGPRNTAIAGLTTGGLQALVFGMTNLDLFSWVGLFSHGYTPEQGMGLLASLADEVEETNEKLSLLWIACGRQDFLRPRAEYIHDWLSQNGIEHSWYDTDGGHEFDVWRDHIARFMMLLFRPNTQPAS